MPTPPLLQRLKERKLVQWALAYLAGAFVVFQLLDALAEPLGLTTIIQRAVLAVVCAGFFITLVLAWYHGEKGQQKISGAELLMVAALLVIAGGVLSMLGGPRESGLTPSTRVDDDRPGIAVLPCENMSADPADGYLASSLHDEILLKLQGISSLFSIGRQSVLRYAEDPVAAHEIAADLRVGFVGECSVQKYGDHIRLIFQLLDGRTGGQLAAYDYDEAMTSTNISGILRQIAQEVASALHAELSPGERSRIAAVPTENTEAYTFFLRGKDALDRAGWEQADFELAREMLRRAVDLDPEFPLAHAWLSSADHLEYMFYDRSEVWLERGRAAGEEALRLDPDLPEAHLTLAFRHFVQYENEEAMAALRLAEEGLLGHPDLLLMKFQIQTRLWQWDAALETLEHAAQLDPRNAEIAFELGQAYGDRHRWEESDAYLDLAMELDPSFYEAGLIKGYRYFLRTGDGGPALDFLAGVPPDAEVFGLRGMFEWFFSGSGADRIAALERIEQPILEFGGFYWAPRELIEGRTYAEADPSRARRAFEVAVAVCRAALTDRPSAPSIHVALARAYAALGRSEEAVREAQLAQELLPVTKDPTFGRELLSMTIPIYAQLGMVEETVEAVETFYSIPNPQLPEVFLPQIAYPAIREHPRFQALLEKYLPDMKD